MKSFYATLALASVIALPVFAQTATDAKMPSKSTAPGMTSNCLSTTKDAAQATNCQAGTMGSGSSGMIAAPTTGTSAGGITTPMPQGGDDGKSKAGAENAGAGR